MSSCPAGYYPVCVKEGTEPPPGSTLPGTPPGINPPPGGPPVTPPTALFEVYAIPWAAGAGIIGYSPVIMDTRTGSTRPATLDELKIAAEKTLLAIAVIENEGGTTPPTTDPKVQSVCR